MTRPNGDDLYVGYATPTAGQRRFLRRVAGLALVSAVGLGAAMAFGERDLPPAVFEFGTARDFTGWIETDPYPTLLVARPGQVPPGATVSRYLLVAPGKHGADALLAGHADSAVELRGTLIWREDQTMIEVLRESVRHAGGVPRPWLAQPEQLGDVTLRGEIVDSKCFLGVMNPAAWTPHRGCAVRCLSGGIPPMLVLRDADGRVSAYVLLAGADGRALGRELLSLVARPVEVRGRLERRGEELRLRADPSAYRWLQ